jgi:predicted NodU family carbamoyl transferase
MNLLLTLGHNSSAILTDNDQRITAGYEEERLNRVKSSSQFPKLSIEECFKNTSGHEHDRGYLYVSHWFDDFDFHRNGFSDKHWDPYQVKAICDSHNMELVTLTSQFTHHDAHAWAARAFFEAHSLPLDPIHICVADGFGNKEEVFSVYKWTPKKESMQLVHRVYGYENSLGLLYQYATSYCGMKENQDEYKFLGYETWVDDVLTNKEIADLQNEASAWASKYRSAQSPQSTNKSYINVDRLIQVKNDLWAKFDVVIETTTGKSKASFSKSDLRKIIGHFVQSVIEAYYTDVIEEFSIDNIIVTGGLHYNVKLNNHILARIPGEFCATPLAGDQGAAIGLMRYHEGSVLGLDSLLWGHRDLSIPNTLVANGHEFKPGHFYFNNKQSYVDFVVSQLKLNKIVNTVTGPMEFGPRALCNTTTLALPTEKNVATINSLNGRDTVMPMAPVMLKQYAHEFFSHQDISRVAGSLEYMILTLDYHTTVDVNRFRGVMHPYPKFGRKYGYSGRPQLIEVNNIQPISNILRGMYPQHPALINTSLNVHGVPIVFSAQDAINDMAFNLDEARDQGLEQPILVIGNFK